MLYLICNRQKLISDCNLLGSFIHQLGIIWQLISTGHDLKAELFLHLTMTDAVLLSIVSYQPWKSSGLIWILDKRHSTLEVELLKRIPLPTREPPTQKKMILGHPWRWFSRLRRDYAEKNRVVHYDAKKNPLSARALCWSIIKSSPFDEWMSSVN